MDFNYESSTKNAYKNKDVALKYHLAFDGHLNWKTVRFHFIAYMERRIVKTLLEEICAVKLLDIPCGTGKLAPILAKGHYEVTAVDISPDMLNIARNSYSEVGLVNTKFFTGDAEVISQQLGSEVYDAVICMRLMHRVPQPVRLKILQEISRVANYSIVSFGVKSQYNNIRKKARNLIFWERNNNEEPCLESIYNIECDLSNFFHPVKKIWVSKYLSEEVFFLLKSKVFDPD